MQGKSIGTTNILSAAAVVLGGFVGLAFGKWMATREEAAKKLELQQIQERTNTIDLEFASKFDPLRFPTGKFWNREQMVYSLLFPLLKHSLNSTPQVYRIRFFLPEDYQNHLTADLTTDLKYNLATRRIDNGEQRRFLDQYYEFDVVSWNLENGTFEFRSVFDTVAGANAGLFEGQIISINSSSLRMAYTDTSKGSNGYKVVQIHLYSCRPSVTTNQLFKRLQHFELNLPIERTHFALSELFDLTKVDSRQFDEILGTNLVNSVSQAKATFDNCSPLPIVLRQLTFEYAS